MLEPGCPRLVDLLETNAERLSRELLADINRRPETATSHDHSNDERYRRAYAV